MDRLKDSAVPDGPARPALLGVFVHSGDVASGRGRERYERYIRGEYK